MIMTRNSIITRNSVFAWLALATGVLLLVPAVAMQFTSEVNWNGADFAVMGALVFGMGSLFVLVARKVSRKYRFAIGVFFALALCYVWAELAVGIFTDLGS
ncbi:MAG TPA: hypothetical protein VIL60_09185 [Rhodanobacter sp.]